jgi:hypothetical protein
MPLAHEKHAPPQSDRRIVSLTLRSEQRGQLSSGACSTEDIGPVKPNKNPCPHASA